MEVRCQYTKIDFRTCNSWKANYLQDKDYGQHTSNYHLPRARLDNEAKISPTSHSLILQGVAVRLGDSISIGTPVLTVAVELLEQKSKSTIAINLLDGICGTPALVVHAAV